MRTLLPILSIGLLLPLLTGCPNHQAWDGVTAEEYARLNEHRLLGIAFLENAEIGSGKVTGPGDSAATQALQEFETIQKAQPKLAFGYVNAAAALIQQHKGAEAVKAATKGTEVRPNSGWAQLVLGEAYTLAGDQQNAAKALQAAKAAEPQNIRILGAALDHLEMVPGDHTQEAYSLRQAIARQLPGNLVAQLNWTQAQAQRSEWGGALKSLEEVVKSLPKVPESAQPFLVKSRSELSAHSDAAKVSLQQFGNTLKQSSAYTAFQAEIFGNSHDPANLLMREWDTPPPALSAPAFTAPIVRWSDNTSVCGLEKIEAHGIAPVAVGDYTLWLDAGTRENGLPQRFQDRDDLVVGPTPEGLLINNGHGFDPATLPPLPSASPLLADLNNDFSLDLYAADPAGDQVWFNPRHAGQQTEQGYTFTQDSRMLPPVTTPGKGPGTATAVDLDLDGDLDILRASSSPDQPAVRYLRNNGNRTFTDLTATCGLKMPSLGARQAVFLDYDDNGTPDVFVVRADGPCQLFENRRQDVFRNASAVAGIKPDAGARCAIVGDFDRDGRWDLAVAGHAPHGCVLYHNTGGKFTVDTAAFAALSGFDADWIELLDYDNDTWLDLAVAGPSGVRLLHNDHGKFIDAGQPLLSKACTWMRAFDYDGDGAVDLLVTDGDGKLHLLRNEGGSQAPWLRVELQGLVLPGQNGGGAAAAEAPTAPPSGSQATNSYGIGSTIEVRTPWEQQKILVTSPVSSVGLGRSERAMTLRTIWTDGVPQNSVAPPLRATLHYEQKPTGSCPFLYTWDGERWQFACDFNWRSPLGMRFAPGAPIPHNQTGDWVKLAGDLVHPIGDFYPLVATEELRETSYFDSIRMLAVDHPAEAEIYVDERFRLGPQPEFRIYTARDRRAPVAARDGTGADLLPALRKIDNVFTPVPAGPYRGIREPHDLVLDLGQVPDPAQVRLYLNGWLYPANTSTYIAASQNPEIKIIPPTLYVGDGKGGWTEADRGVGLPCGKRKTMVLDLSNRFVGHDYRVKLTTTMEIRWDAAFFTSGDAEVTVRKSELPLASADLTERGYGAHYKDAEDGPDLFDFNRTLTGDRAPGWPEIRGSYTRLGECRPLLTSVDDRYAIVAPGDALRLLYDGRKLPALPAGWKRDFIVMSDGWTKDTDPSTVSGETVEPLPFHGMKRYPYGSDEHFPTDPAHQAWQREWNTRAKGGARTRPLLP